MIRKITYQKLAPFISVFFVVWIGVAYVFVKMETVRRGYEILHLAHTQKVASHEKAALQLHYARLTRPQRLDYIATSRLALNHVQKNQVILMAAQGFAVRQ